MDLDDQLGILQLLGQAGNDGLLLTVLFEQRADNNLGTALLGCERVDSSLLALPLPGGQVRGVEALAPQQKTHGTGKGSRVRGKARKKLNALIASKLNTARAWELKEAFGHFWKYKSVLWAGGFLDAWCERALRSRLEPMQKVARMLRNHEELLMNWFRAKGELSSAAVEGLNNKIRVITRRSYGFRTCNGIEVALYHTLGRLPEPESTHRFC